MTRRIKPVPKVDISEQSPIGGRIAWWAENTLVRFIKRVFNDIAENIKNVISYALEELIDFIEDGLISMGSPIFDIVLNSPNVPDYIKQPIIDARRGESAAAVALIIPLLAAGIVAIAMAFVGPITRVIQYEVEEYVQSYRPPPETLVAMGYRGILDPNRYQDYINELGVSSDLQAAYSDLYRKRLSDDELAALLLRGDIGDSEFDAELTKRGMAGYDIGLFKNLLEVIPPINDLIRMVVREAWDDEAARVFGYDDGDYSEAAQWAAKQGLSPEWIKRYWRAHWELPGVREGFEMLHRRIIDDGQLELLLKLKDIPTFWRKGLTDLSYNVVTRVDIRRMYEMGSVTQEEVYETYLDLGYKPEDAEKLTEWTILEYGENSRDLAKGDIVGSYTDGVLNAEEAVIMLSSLGYSDDEIALLLARADLKRQEEFEKEFVENVRLNYIADRIDETGVVSELNKLDPPTGFVDDKLQIWNLQKQRGVRRPSKADLKKFWLYQVLTEDEIRSEFKKQKYDDLYIDWYLTLWLRELEG